jgi:hypothetical protein
MPKNFYPPEGHDFVNTNDIRSIYTENAARIDAKYNEDAILLKAAVIVKLLGHKALGGGIGWAIFLTEPCEEPDYSAPAKTYELETLLLVQGSNGSEVDSNRGSSVSASVRFITNQAYYSDADINYFAEDVTIDEDNDSQMFVGAMATSQMHDQNKTLAPLFTYKENTNKLRVYNAFPRTPIVMISSRIRGQYTEIDSRPFGEYSNTEDKIHAYNRAKAIFDNVADTEPLHHHKL